jgi:hypothetical protein
MTIIQLSEKIRKFYLYNVIFPETKTRSEKQLEELKK